MEVDFIKALIFKGVIFLMCIGGVIGSYAQDSLLIDEKFISPVDHKLKLAGSFGELRANHFHAGIDIKSRTGEEGDTIRASAAGFISRIKVQRGGYGQVLYLDHPNGFTTVYAHLRSFSSDIASYVEEKQLSNRSYEIDLYPEPERFSFIQGEVLGLMGNTGNSYGPHLHFEIRKTETEVPENPYLHGLGPADTRPPLLYSVEAHGLDSEHHKIWSGSHKADLTKEVITKTIEVPAWRVGMAIQTFDLMDGANNKNGIYSIEMFVDDSLHYSHIMDRVGFDVSRYINSHVDYQEKKKNNRTLTKCYVSPGNKLPFYPDVSNFGEIKIFKDVVRTVRFVIKDFVGNTTEYTCKLKRREAKEGEITQLTFQKYLKQGEAVDFKLGSCRFFFPANALDKNTYINYKEELIDGKVSFNLNEDTDPLFSYPVVSVPLIGISDSTLYQKVTLIKDDKYAYGGHVENDSLRVRIGEFGKYSIQVDTIPPTIEVGSFLKNAVGKPYFRFAIDDNYEAKGYTEDLKYDVFIDGQWVIASLKAIGNELIVPLYDVISGNHILQLRVEDAVGNVTTWEREFNN